MAGHQVPSSAMELIVCNTPTNELALTNCVYCCPSDFPKFSVHGITKKHLLASIGYGYILSLHPHDAIPPGHIALNRIQRKVARVFVGETVRASRFVPPADFDLTLLLLELRFVKRGTKSEQFDAAVLANHLREKFHNQVLKVGQRVAFDLYGNEYIFKVTRAVGEGPENWKRDPERGIFSANSAVVFSESGASGIKINGMDVLLPSIPNRKDLLEEALLRPGQLEVQVETSLPDENGRLQIFRNQTNKMKEHSFLSPDVNLQELATHMKNYTGAEIGGVVRSAVSFALSRQLRLDDLTKPIDEEGIRVIMEDFHKAQHEITPAFGTFDVKKVLQQLDIDEPADLLK